MKTFSLSISIAILFLTTKARPSNVSGCCSDQNSRVLGKRGKTTLSILLAAQERDKKDKNSWHMDVNKMNSERRNKWFVLY